MKHTAEKLARTEKLERLKGSLEPGKTFRAGGVYASSASALLLALAQSLEKPACIITPTIEKADSLSRELEPWLPRRVINFPAWESLGGGDATPDFDIYSGRLHAVARLTGHSDGPAVVVGSIQAFLQPVCERDALEGSVLELRVNEGRDMRGIAAWLVEREFERTDMVEAPGQFSIRGGIMDIFPISAGGVAEGPVRLDFFGDAIESIRRFDPATQRSTGEIESCRIVALGQSSFYKPLPEAGAPLLTERLADGSLIVVSDMPRMDDKVGELDAAVAAESHRHAFDSLMRDAGRHARLEITSPPFAETGNAVNFDVRSVQRFEGKLEDVRERLTEIASRSVELVIYVLNEAEAQRLEELFGDAMRAAGERLRIEQAPLEEGYDFRDISVVAVPYHQLFNRRRQARIRRKYRHFAPVDGYLELEKNDYVVHLAHGIGRFQGVQRVEKDGLANEYLVIEYQDNARIYEPILNIELVQKYVGVKGFSPKLDRLGTRYWSSRKARVKEAVKSMAADLLRVQAARAASPGIEYPPDDEWQHEFERSFEYDETPDQLEVTTELKADMQSPRPMDRLICGDVGYGKTEVAMRAAFKAVTSGRQVAVLVPTTVLAQQHYETFRQRTADFPVEIDVLSRFKTASQQRRTVERLKSGNIDIIIGTHRLLSNDIEFKDLGLLIIDEEQRFGVSHKEKLKSLRATVDIITMTATPIPRTLHMAMLGIKDISSLTTPPRDRLAIRTEVCRYDPRKIRESIMRELNRDGQAFFVHNRVMSIRKVAEALARIVPEATYGIVHGQMHEDEIERAMVDFVEKKFDVLVATTIIESGLDIPNVNTIFINDAHMYGLADLHQLRGRVGRYKHRAYAYLLLPSHVPLSEIAEKRLRAIEEFDELGAGFRIAMRDLEIRGAGNILGAEQHGHMTSVGYDMYCRLLRSSVQELTNIDVDEPITTVIDIGLETSIPESYVPGREQRMKLYRRMSGARNLDELGALAEEMRDRFGPLPEPVKDLLAVAGVRQASERLGVRKIQMAEGALMLRVRNLADVQRAFKPLEGRVRLVDESSVHIHLNPEENTPPAALALLKKYLQTQAAIL
jgi:transcription-repair coupling factor (superfamily II helicase)